MSTLFVIRGPSGSGKSTYASKLGVLTFEADHYFMHEGRYEWEASGLKYAHGWCRAMVRSIMEEGGIDVAVSNTSTMVKEFQPYIDMAKEYGYNVKVIQCVGNYQNTHSVPPETVKKMQDRMENYPGEEIYVPQRY